MKKLTLSIKDLKKKYTVMYIPQINKNDDNLAELALKYAPIIELKEKLETLNSDIDDINYIIDKTPKEDDEYIELLKTRISLNKEKKELIKSNVLTEDINFIEMVKDYDKIALNNLKLGLKDGKAKNELLEEIENKNLASIVENELNNLYEIDEIESKKK